MTEAMQHTEAGVTYSHNRFPTLEPIPNHFTIVEYNWFHKTTGKSGLSKLWIEKTRHVENDLKKLTDHWSRGDWEYTPVKIEETKAPATKVTKQITQTGNKQMPMFTHDCNACSFLGTHREHDVYHCGDSIGGNGSIIARYGNDGPEYSSIPLDMLKSMINRNGNVGGTDENNQPWNMPYQDYIFSNRCIPATAAMILALTLKAIG